MYRNHYSRFFLIVGIFVAAVSSAIAQTKATAKDFTISLSNLGSAFVNASDIDKGSTSASGCGSPALSIAYVLKNTTTSEYKSATFTAPITGTTVNVFTGVYEARYETVPDPIIYINYPDATGSYPAPAGTYKFFDATAVVEGLLLGKSSVTVPVNNTLVGDPYPYIVKQLTVSALYAPILTNKQLSFSSTGTYTVALVVRDGCGVRSIALSTVTVTPYEARCGTNGDKYLICHNGHTLCVPASAVPAHLAHGDLAGGCAPSPALLIQTQPNPASGGQFRVQVQAADAGATQVSLHDMQGTFIGKLLDGSMQAGEQREISVNRPELRQGIYLIRVQNGQKSSSTRVELQ